jgi:polyisoprenoid-binding protein YceI
MRLAGWTGTWLLIAACGARAELAPYEFDRGHSRIFFDYDHQGYSVMLGMFREFGGTFLFDPDNPRASRLDITIDAASVDVFDAELNERLKGEDFFDVANHPELRFVSRGVEPTGENAFRVSGDLTMLGQTRPVVFEVVQNKLAVNRQGSQVAGFSARGSLKRADFGMGFLVPFIAENVMFRIEVEASPAESGS